MRLFRSEMPVGAPSSSRRTSNTENGRRSSGSWPRAGLDHHELSGRGGGGDGRRREREDVVVGRQRAVGDHVGGDVDRHRGVYRE